MKQLIVLFACIFALNGLAKAGDDKPITMNELPQKSQQFIHKFFAKEEISLVKMEKEMWDKSYEVIFTNGQKVEFDKNGVWKEVDCQYSAVPKGILPEAIQKHVTEKYPNAKILKIEQDSKKIEVELDNKLELKFNHNNQLIGIDH